ncbi:hypothetical protein C2E23DRAFT_868898 [Lenzites betulinus]|nr:hypothetical protein C2E23DRAFT_868898 [Lenzites betulinus]
MFEWLLAKQQASGLEPCNPFVDFIQNYLKLNIIRTQTKPSFESSYMFSKKIDALPAGDIMKVVGDRLWLWDAMDCVKELLGNLLLYDLLRYAPNGDKSAWPVYLTLGNIDKCVQHQPSAHVTVLLEYLPVTKLECFSDKCQSLQGYWLFHLCMKKLLAPLVAAGRHGLLMTCNHCPKCPVPPDKHGEPVFTCLKDPAHISKILKQTAASEKAQAFAELGLQAVEPFWDELPHVNIFTMLTPNLLHQLYKGVFQDHLVSWATQAIPEGTNEKAFLGIIAGAANKYVIHAVYAILDFIYLVHFRTHTDTSLEALHQAWHDFHNCKHIFVELEIREHFNFPKGHLTEHYKPSIHTPTETESVYIYYTASTYVT